LIFISIIIGYYFAMIFIENKFSTFEKTYTAIKAVEMAFSAIVQYSNLFPSYDSLYVDDILITGTKQEIKKKNNTITDVEDANFIGIKFHSTRKGT